MDQLKLDMHISQEMSREITVESYSDIALTYDVELWSDFLEEKEHTELFTELRNKKWGNPQKHKRGYQAYGDTGLESYSFEMYGRKIERKFEEWPESLLSVKTRLEKALNVKFNCAITLLYQSRKVGIKPHRDKELRKGVPIVGLSLGDTRIMRIRTRDGDIDLTLSPGSVYVLKGETNRNCTHEILEEEVIKENQERISLTFRLI